MTRIGVTGPPSLRSEVSTLATEIAISYPTPISTPPSLLLLRLQVTKVSGPGFAVNNQHRKRPSYAKKCHRTFDQRHKLK